MRTVGSYALHGRHHGRSTLYLPGLEKEAPSGPCGSRERRRLRLDHTKGGPRGCGERAALPGPACRARRGVPAHHPRTLRLRLAEARTSENAHNANFVELRYGEVRRILLMSTSSTELTLIGFLGR